MPEEIFKLIFKAVPEAVWLLDSEGRIIAGNPASSRVSGMAAGASAGQPLASLFKGVSGDLTEHLVQAATAGQIVSFRARLSADAEPREYLAELWHMEFDGDSRFVLRCDPFKLAAGHLVKINKDLEILEANLLEQKRREFKLLSKARNVDKDRQKFEDEAMRDSLTNLPNRRYFKKQLLILWGMCRQDGLPLAMLMIDVDRFKDYNDHFGHPAGDACLIEVGRALGEGLHRGQDVLARIGGEEFAVLLPNADIDGASMVAERLRLKVRARQIVHAPGSDEEYVTISVGGAVGSPCEGIDSGAISHLADELLYQAKQAGRNRVRIGAAESDWSSVVPVLRSKPDGAQ